MHGARRINLGLTNILKNAQTLKLEPALIQELVLIIDLTRQIEVNRQEPMLSKQ